MKVISSSYACRILVITAVDLFAFHIQYQTDLWLMSSMWNEWCLKCELCCLANFYQKCVTMIPFIQPGNLWAMALSNSSGDIQRPSWLTALPSGVGTVSLWTRVTITVLLSTRATSLGSVRANQLQDEEEEDGEKVTKRKIRKGEGTCYGNF